MTRSSLVLAGCLSIAAGSSLAPTGCAPPDDGAAPEPVAAKQDALFSRTIYESSQDRIVPPFTAAVNERGLFFARTVAAATAFQQCTQNTMTNQYLYINDPNPALSRDARIAAAYQSFRASDNTLSFGLRPRSDAPTAGASAWIGSPTDYGTKGVTLYAGFRADFPDWVDGVFSAFASRPWNYFADGMVHEFMHTQGYYHADTTCSDSEGNPPVSSCILHPECAWTSYCGGPGTPPSSMTYATAGDSQRELVAVKNGLRDTQYYYRGEPSAPYIYGRCAGAIVERSFDACPGVTTYCGPSMLRLVSGWSGTMDTPQTSANCSCAQDPRHVIALANPDGWVWVPTDGGGSPSVQTRLTHAFGAWQALDAIETASPGGWLPNEPIALKAFGGQFFSNTFSPTLTTPSTVLFENADSSVYPIMRGSLVRLYTWDALGYRLYAYDNGSTIGTTYRPDASATFTVIEPRYHLVYLATYHGRFVNTDPDATIHNRKLPGDLQYATQLAPGPDALDPARVAAQANAAFWLLDWNGGDLVDGDVVSFQLFQNDAWNFISTFGTTGVTRPRNGAGADERFVIHKLSGSAGTRIANRDVVSLRSSSGTYLTAMPPDFSDSQLQSSGTSEGLWQRIGVQFVHSFDMDRTSKW